MRRAGRWRRGCTGRLQKNRVHAVSLPLHRCRCDESCEMWILVSFRCERRDDSSSGCNSCRLSCRFCCSSSASCGDVAVKSTRAQRQPRAASAPHSSEPRQGGRVDAAQHSADRRCVFPLAHGVCRTRIESRTGFSPCAAGMQTVGLSDRSPHLKPSSIRP